MSALTDTLNEMVYRRRVQRLWRLGPRAIAELLAEIGAERSIRTTIDEKLERYTGFEPAVLRAVRADQLPATPLHVVRR